MAENGGGGDKFLYFLAGAGIGALAGGSYRTIYRRSP